MENVDPVFRLRAILAVLNDVKEEFAGRTIENIISNIEDIINYHNKKKQQ